MLKQIGTESSLEKAIMAAGRRGLHHRVPGGLIKEDSSKWNLPQKQAE